MDQIRHKFAAKFENQDIFNSLSHEYTFDYDLANQTL